MIKKIEKYEIVDLIKGAISEDMGGFGDITSKYLIPDKEISSAYIVCKEPEGAILSGLDIAAYIFEEIDPEILLKPLKDDGASLDLMDRVCDIKGAAASMLKAERTCLNFIQHMSGIATLTAKFVKIAASYGVKIVDTRKTKPMLRKVEKYAVLCGGGHNHRFGLFDGVLIKDNHIAAAGSVLQAIDSIRVSIPHTIKIEVEIKDFDELDQALEARADIIMLDNMGPEDMIKAVRIIRGKREETIIEASGNVNLGTLEDICKTGIDIISVGALTHSAPAIDFSMEFE
ncbi:MAG TPA: carboxylating nicotinate-nucleotide diphosphorylase [Actinobacteria bacterium]|nr:carboxylating nicotinate-nucleotide diphosphorylase [Actinomycetota bacterium]